MQKAVFLDRDGVINRELGQYVTRFDEFHLLPHALPGIRQLMDNDYMVVVITNQGGIAKGLYTREDLNAMHTYLQNTCMEYCGRPLVLYVCPHHPDFGKCLCRKPDSLLIEKALARYDIDASQSYFIGDRDRDIQAAQKAGVKGLLIESNQDWSQLVQGILSGTV